MSSTVAGSRLFNADEARGNLWHGEWRAASAVLDVTEPATGESLLEVGRAGAEDVTRAAGEAAAAQGGWAARPAAERGTVMARAAELLEAHHEEAETWLVREAGSIRPKAGFEVMQLVLGELPDDPRDPVGCAGARAGQRRDPQGRPPTRRCPAGSSSPRCCTRPACPPGSCTCSLVPWRPVRRSASPRRSGWSRSRGRPPSGGWSARAAGATSSASRSSSAATTRSSCSRTPTWMRPAPPEPGGSFLHQGQICMTAGRHLVHEKIADAYLKALAARASHLPVGDPNTQQAAIGPLIDAEHVARVDELVQDAKRSGAQVLAGGEPDAPFYPPTVLSSVRTEMRAWKEEIFGPVAPVMTFSTDREAIALANASEHGLSTGIYTSDLEHGRRLADQVRTGLVHIGDQTVNDDPAVPFGGVGASGSGARFGGPANLEEFLQWPWLTERDEPATYPF